MSILNVRDSTCQLKSSIDSEHETKLDRTNLFAKLSCNFHVCLTLPYCTKDIFDRRLKQIGLQAKIHVAK